MADVVFSQKALGSPALWWEYVGTGACSCGSPRTQRPPDGGTRSAEPEVPALGGTRRPPRTPCCVPYAMRPSAPCHNSLRSSASPEELALSAWSPFGGLGEHPRVSTPAGCAGWGEGVSEPPRSSRRGRSPATLAGYAPLTPHRTTSQHCASGPGDSQLLGPCIPPSRRRNRLSSRGLWPPYSSQNLCKRKNCQRVPTCSEQSLGQGGLRGALYFKNQACWSTRRLLWRALPVSLMCPSSSRRMLQHE